MSSSSISAARAAVKSGSSAGAGTIAYTSNRANMLSLFAPGSAILSSDLNEGYAWASGTSMAAPHVTGAVAVIASKYPKPLGAADVAAIEG